MGKNTHLTEKQVLEKLGICDFRHVSKDKIMTFFSMLPDMEPEVAKKAMDQFPVYAGTVKEIVSDYMNFLDKALADNTESMRSCYAVCSSILDALSKILEKDEYTFEEKKYIIEQMLEVEFRISQKDTQNKKYRLKIIDRVSMIILTVIGFLAVILGANFRLPLSAFHSGNSDN